MRRHNINPVLVGRDGADARQHCLDEFLLPFIADEIGQHVHEIPKDFRKGGEEVHVENAAFRPSVQDVPKSRTEIIEQQVSVEVVPGWSSAFQQLQERVPVALIGQ